MTTKSPTDAGMAYSRIFRTIWASDSFLALSAQGQRMFFYLLTCPENTSLTGLIRQRMSTISDVLRLTPDETATVFGELEAEGMAAYDPSGVVWLPNATRFSAPANPSVVKSWGKSWREIPNCALKAVSYDVLRRWCESRGATFLAAFDATCDRPRVSARRGAAETTEPQKPATGHRVGHGVAHGVGHRVGHGVAHQEQEQEQEQEKEKYSAQARMCVREDSSATDPPDLPTVAEPPPSAKTAPSALPADEDEATGPLTSRGASLPLFRATAPTDPPAPSPAPLPPAPVAPSAPVVVVAPEPCPAPPPACVSPDPDHAEVTPAPSPSAAGSDPEADDSPTVRGAVGEVFAHWSRVVWANAHVAPKLTKERRTRIKARLAEGYTVADLCLALDGVRHDPWLMGTADGARPGGYRDVMTVLRDGAQVERLMGLAKQHAPRERKVVVSEIDLRIRAQVEKANRERPIQGDPLDIVRAWESGLLGASAIRDPRRTEVRHAV